MEHARAVFWRQTLQSAVLQLQQAAAELASRDKAPDFAAKILNDQAVLHCPAGFVSGAQSGLCAEDLADRLAKNMAAVSKNSLWREITSRKGDLILAVGDGWFERAWQAVRADFLSLEEKIPVFEPLGNSLFLQKLGMLVRNAKAEGFFDQETPSLPCPIHPGEQNIVFCLHVLADTDKGRAYWSEKLQKQWEKFLAQNTLFHKNASVRFCRAVLAALSYFELTGKH